MFEMGNNVFKGRSLNVIADFSIAERRYFFKKVNELKKAIVTSDFKTQDKFRINDPDFGIYEVFIENSTRTKESFRNAAKFHHAKVSELITTGSSINKGESYADTFNTLSGYQNRMFIRSTVEGLTKWLSEETERYCVRNGLPYKPSFINAGDGRHEHPTQELLDEFSFLEDTGMRFDSIHLALVGDLYHGRTVHSKTDGLKLFDNVKVDLIAPPELQMPDEYVEKMKENGFAVRSFGSIEEYLDQKDVALTWYFTRPQLERMGDKVLNKADKLRESIVFRKEFIDKIDKNTKFYHPLPRHKEHPTIPTWLDETSFNGWERQSINGYYCRIVLIGLLAGIIGDDFEPETSESGSVLDEKYIVEVDPGNNAPKNDESGYAEGMRPLWNGLVIDHICKGENPSEIREHMNSILHVLKLDEGRGGTWVGTGKDGKYKGLIVVPEYRDLDTKELKRLAAVASGATLNIIKDFKVIKKYRTHMPPRIYNFDDIACANPACITHPANSENVPNYFIRTKDNHFECAYCGKFHTFKEIWKR